MRFLEVKTFLDGQLQGMDLERMASFSNDARERLLTRLQEPGALAPRSIFGVAEGVGRDATDDGGAAMNKLGASPQSNCLYLKGAELKLSGQLGLVGMQEKGTSTRLNRIGQSIFSALTYSSAPLLEQFSDVTLDLFDTGKFNRYATEYGTGYTIEDSPYSPRKLFPLAMELLAARKGITLDWEASDIRVDRFFVDFARIGMLTDDEDLYQRWFGDLCQAHLEAVARDIDEEDAMFGFEFDLRYYALWPIDVLAALRVRAELGLPCPPVNHILMQQPLAQLTQITCEDRSQADLIQPFIDYIKSIEPRLSAL